MFERTKAFLYGAAVLAGVLTLGVLITLQTARKKIKSFISVQA